MAFMALLGPLMAIAYYVRLSRRLTGHVHLRAVEMDQLGDGRQVQTYTGAASVQGGLDEDSFEEEEGVTKGYAQRSEMLQALSLEQRVSSLLAMYVLCIE